MSKHHIFSPSSLERRILCPASMLEELKYPEEKTNIYAAEGTFAHEIAANLLRFKFENKKDLVINYKNKQEVLIGNEKIHLDLDIFEMYKHVGNYCQYIEDLLNKDCSIFIEQRVPLEKYLPKTDRDDSSRSGSADCIIYNDSSKTAHIIDLKYGKGKVEVKDNHQLRAYALGTMELLNIRFGKNPTKYILHIYQPRINNIKTIKYSEKEIRVYGLDLFKKLLLCLEDKPKYNPSIKACMWCKAKSNCKARLETIKKDYSDDFEIIN